jgi:hypothetical protein
MRDSPVGDRCRGEVLRMSRIDPNPPFVNLGLASLEPMVKRQSAIFLV